jgi:sugar lactone lactonase YvrE
VRATHAIDPSEAGATSPTRVHEWPVFCSSLRSLLLVGGWMLWVATASADALFVSNFNTNTILRFDLAGNPTPFADASDGLLMPDSLVFDASGNLFVANRGARNILRFDPMGNPSVFADAGDGLLAPFALAFDSTGNLFVANATGGGLTGNNNILRFDPAGNATVFADASDGITDPRGLAFDSQGNLFVVNQQFVRGGRAVDGNILKFDPAGNATLSWESSAFFFLDELTIDANDNLFVSNLGPANILRVDPVGNVAVFATGVVATGFAFDASDNLFVARGFLGGDMILRFDPAGDRTVFADASDGLSFPNGLAFAAIPTVSEPGTIPLWVIAAIGMMILRRRKEPAVG